MSGVCKINPWLSTGVSIAIQVTFIFLFLTVFFFLYVQEVEKKEFERQLNIVVDSLVDDIKGNLNNLISKQKDYSPEEAYLLTTGIIELVESKIALDSGTTVHEILKNNHQVKLKALKTMITVVVILTLISLGIIMIGFCLPIGYQIREAMLVVVFVGLTELTFLQLIAKNYISASPNKIKRMLATSIQNWIKKNKKV